MEYKKKYLKYKLKYFKLKGGNKNIKGAELESCKENNMSYGSWDNEGKCSDRNNDLGKHQICVKNLSTNLPNFSKNTGQSDWSNKRGKNNHCVCLGAWALYIKQIKDKIKKYEKTNKVKYEYYKNLLNKNVLKCDAIPDSVFNPKYIDQWKTWNGNELPKQIVEGVNQLHKICNTNKKKYCDLGIKEKSISDSKYYKSICGK